MAKLAEKSGMKVALILNLQIDIWIALKLTSRLILASKLKWPAISFFAEHAGSLVGLGCTSTKKYASTGRSGSFVKGKSQNTPEVPVLG